jgi:short-subunit dehydrogenase
MVLCDVGARAQVQHMIEQVLHDFGRIDVLINNAGIGMRLPFAETSLDLIEAIMRTNYLGMVYCTHGVLPSMMARRAGSIVNISSIAGIAGFRNIAAYSASKFAMNGFSESLYHEVKPYGIHVAVVCPGPVRTDFTSTFPDTPPKTPSSAMVEPELISGVVLKTIERKRFQVVPPWWLGLAAWLKQVAPAPVRALTYRLTRGRGEP